MKLAALHPDAPLLTIHFTTVPSLNLLAAVCTVVIGEEHDFELLKQIHVLELLAPGVDEDGDEVEGCLTMTGRRDLLDRLAEFVDTVTGGDDASHPWPQGELQITKRPDPQGDQG